MWGLVALSFFLVAALAYVTEMGRLSVQYAPDLTRAGRDEKRIALTNQRAASLVRNTHHMQHDAPLGLR